ncbi:MerR family transcriptional regulator [Cytophaga aurantiaca]|uniref:MerR family transcriptional regulator n=1 Tax=Cytophaga aurantiaca TaxID=29530 RepID=UPI0004774D44|nr:MerR family transcriptional regulator [Cytophaga aurantiaca]
MVQFSIKDLERITGIKAHTIRIWEQRYNIITPQRMSNNIRFYSNEDLKRILNVSVLNKNGLKISKIAHLTPDQLNSEVKKIIDTSIYEDNQIEGLIVSMIELNEDNFQEIISNTVSKHGLIKTIEHTIYPFFEKIGILWQTGAINPAQEHFISNLIRQKIIVSIDSVSIKPDPTKETFLLFLPESELHEISLLVYTYLLKSKGYKVIYLGQSVPYVDLLAVVHSIQPQKIVTAFTNPFAEGMLQEYLNKLSCDFPDCIFFVSGYQFIRESVKLPTNIILHKGLDAFKKLV